MVQGVFGGIDKASSKELLSFYKLMTSDGISKPQADLHTEMNMFDPKILRDKGMDYTGQFMTTPSRIAKEPNAVNVKIEQDFSKNVHYRDYGSPKIINFIIDYVEAKTIGNHSDFKNLETMQILQKEIEKRRSGE